MASETPGSIHEGGELGYALVHAYRAAFDNPDLVVACVIGDGEAETGPLAASWHSNKFLNPLTDGAVLPILHLNGYKIANPTVLSRIPAAELDSVLRGYGYQPISVAGDDPASVHQQMASALDEVFDQIAAIQRAARVDGKTDRPLWPMIVLRTPNGWTGPKEVDGKPVEGTWRSHQVPLAETHTNARHREQLEEWLRSYRPEELFDADDALRPELRALAPTGERRMSANPHANGELLLRELDLPASADYAVAVEKAGTGTAEATRVLGTFLRDVIVRNPDHFRIMGPDETASNRLNAVFEATNKVWMADTVATDEGLSPSGRVMEVLSEHLCQGWLEGLSTDRQARLVQLLRGVHPHRQLDAQPACEMLSSSSHLPWRRPIASPNYPLTSHVWRQDHNGASHQDPGFIRWRHWPPPTSCATNCPIWRCGWSASSTSCGLQPDSAHPHGLSDPEFDALFTTDKPVIFAYHGYPWLTHRLTYRRSNHAQLHVRGSNERGTTTTPFDMVMLNDLDRFHLVIDVIDRVDGLAAPAAVLRQRMLDARLGARYTREHGEDDSQISNWTWDSVPLHRTD